MPKPRVIVIYGKGGIGKSTVSTHVAVCCARRGLRTLVVGCDPKVDTSSRLMRTDLPPATVLSLIDMEQEVTFDAALMHAPCGVDIIETGGAGPGAGCAGHGVTITSKLLTRERARLDDYDVVIFDVLGDLVCGGFVAPLRSGLADAVAFVTSEEPASLFAANNLAAVVRKPYCEQVKVAGLVFNLRSASTPREPLSELARMLGVPVLAVLTRDRLINKAERAGMTCVELEPEAPISMQFDCLAESLLDASRGTPAPAVTPLSLEVFWKFVRERLKLEEE